MTLAALQHLYPDLTRRLGASASPVERDVASLLDHGARCNDPTVQYRLHRYHRKIDVTHRVMAAYDDMIVKATSAETLSAHGYLGLALVFVDAARRETFVDEASRARVLQWVNSAFNCLDCVRAVDDKHIPHGLDDELETLLQRGVAH
jgi:hypothetical protein